MRKIYLILLVLLIGILSIAIGRRKAEPVNALITVHQTVEGKIASLVSWMENDWDKAVKKKDESSIQKSFLQGREKYKEIEWAVEFFFPTTAKDLNGAPLPEIEVEEHIVIEPSGFQVLEELIFPLDPFHAEDLVKESAKIKSLLYRLQTLWKELPCRDDQVWTAIRLQLLRVSSLGIAGFDTPLSGNSIKELDISLKSIEAIATVYAEQLSREQQERIERSFRSAYSIIRDQEPGSFDYHAFLIKGINPIAEVLLHIQMSLGIKANPFYAVNLDVPGFFDTGAFRLDFFVADANAMITPLRIDLGKKIFGDPVLSNSGKVSCMSCHLPQKAFTDGLNKSRSFGTDGSLARNTPTLLYAGLQQNQFYDMRAGSLEDQVKNVIENKDEIHGSLEHAAIKMNKDSAYKQLFRQAFEQDSISTWNIQVALASYIRSLNPFSSRFDRHMRGELNLSRDEMEGLNIFLGKGKCGTCHFMPLFNGTIPPNFLTTESEVIGVPRDKDFTTISNDSGRYGIYKLPELEFAFKTPTLRNVDRTAPYMHNGVFQTLEEVIEFYDKGGGVGRGLKIENQTLPSDSLQLRDDEKVKLILFLKTLTDDY